MRHLPIILKFLMVLTLFGLCALGAALYATGQMRVIGQRYSQLVNHEDAATLLVARANRNLQAMANAVANLEISGTDDENTAAMNALNESSGKFFSYMKKAASAAPDSAPAIATLVARAHDVIENTCGNAVALGTAAEDPPESQAAQQEYIKKCLPAFTAAIAAMTAQTQAMASLSAQRAEALQAATSRTIFFTLVGMISGILLVTIFGFVAINGWVIVPIKTLQSAMGRLAAGDLQTHVAGASRRDEIGGMARAMDVFKQAGLDKLAAERAAGAHRAEAEALRVRTAAEREVVAAAAARTVAALAAGLENLAAGALAYRLTTPFGETYEKLRVDFNTAMDTLHATMRAIAGNTDGVREGAAEITRATDDLSRRTEQQAASLEQTAAALDEITAAVTAAAAGAAQAGQAAGAAKTEAENSAGIVGQTVSAMSAIEASSRQIGSIIGVIDEIAFQTNLLALNAGVEAARAGDAGRGFAVVAAEVRALAQRSAEAAKEIKGLIATSGRQVQAGVTLVGETGAALTRIVAAVNGLSMQVAAIAGSAQEQAHGLKEVNAALNQMDQVTQQNAAMVEQTSAASHAMAEEAAALAALVEQFSIAAAPAAGAPAASAPAADDGPVRQFSAMDGLKNAATPRLPPAATFGTFKTLPP